jgi:hypothetical protein
VTSITSPEITVLNHKSLKAICFAIYALTAASFAHATTYQMRIPAKGLTVGNSPSNPLPDAGQTAPAEPAQPDTSPKSMARFVDASADWGGVPGVKQLVFKNTSNKTFYGMLASTTNIQISYESTTCQNEGPFVIAPGATCIAAYEVDPSTPVGTVVTDRLAVTGWFEGEPEDWSGEREIDAIQATSGAVKAYAEIVEAGAFYDYGSYIQHGSVSSPALYPGGVYVRGNVPVVVTVSATGEVPIAYTVGESMSGSEGAIGLPAGTSKQVQLNPGQGIGFIINTPIMGNQLTTVGPVYNGGYSLSGAGFSKTQAFKFSIWN